MALTGATAVFLTVRLPPLPTQKWNLDQSGKVDTRTFQKASFDLPGAATLSLFIATLILALSMGGNDIAWNHILILILISFSVVFFASFVFLELRTSHSPLVPLRLLSRRSIWPIFAVTFFKDMAGTPVGFSFAEATLQTQTAIDAF